MSPTIKSSRKIFGPRHFKKIILRLLPCDNKIWKRNEFKFNKKREPLLFFFGKKQKLQFCINILIF